MRNTLGHNVTLTIFGESHGPAIGAVIDGLPGGIKVSEDSIKGALDKRRPSNKGETSRVEKDSFSIVSGVFNGYTNGNAVTILIPNSDTHSNDYEANKGLARPSHADYVAHEKYSGYEDYRGGGHFSGRITAAIVAAGAIVIDALEAKGIKIGTHIEQLGSVKDARFDVLNPEIDAANAKSFPTIKDVSDEMLKEMESAGKDMDSVGGIVEGAVAGLPVGLGEPWFSSVEGELANALFSIGGVKGIEFGLGFGFASSHGSEVNDPLTVADGKVGTTSNNNGGINGGISNGMPVIFRCAIKPTPSIAKEQNTVNLLTGDNAKLSIVGRHDPAIVRRIAPVVRAITSFVIADLLSIECGRNFLVK